MQAAADKVKAKEIASKLIEAKIQNSLIVLDWIAQKYDIQDTHRRAKYEAQNLPKTKTIAQLRLVEGRVATAYWQTFKKIIP